MTRSRGHCHALHMHTTRLHRCSDQASEQVRDERKAQAPNSSANATDPAVAFAPGYDVGG